MGAVFVRSMRLLLHTSFNSGWGFDFERASTRIGPRVDLTERGSTKHVSWEGCVFLLAQDAVGNRSSHLSGRG